MLRVLGSHRRLCSGVSRRDFLHAGALTLSGLGMANLGLPDLLRLQVAAADPPQLKSFGRARSVILLHLYGSPSQLEWADMKPQAPREIRGEFGNPVEPPRLRCLRVAAESGPRHGSHHRHPVDDSSLSHPRRRLLR